MDNELLKTVLKAQRTELTESLVYSKLAKKEKNINRKILLGISRDEKKHHDFWKKISKKEVEPRKFMMFMHILFAKLLGITFSLKLMEKRDRVSYKVYALLYKKFPGVSGIVDRMHENESKRFKVIQDKRMIYTGAIVLGLNDALVELSGALAGFTFALQDSRLVSVTGLITGIAAALSMAASGYLSFKEEEKLNGIRKPLTGAFYTGVTYMFTVFCLVAPYFIFKNIFHALFTMFGIVIFFIFLFTFYTSVAKETSFSRKFFQMAVISLSVALISFLAGIFLKNYFGISV